MTHIAALAPLVGGGALVGALANVLPAQEPTGREIMKLFEVQDRTEDLTAEQTMTLIEAGGSERTRQLIYVTKTNAEGRRSTLIRFLAPADIKGTGFLSIEREGRDDDRWLYLPAVRKTRRIAGADKTNDFIGTEFTYEDLDRENLNVHAYRLAGTDAVDGLEAWIVEAVPIDPRRVEESGYGKRELWVSREHHLLIRAKFYDKSGAYVKLLTTGDIRQVPGSKKWRAYRLSMEDVLKGDRTEVAVTKYEIDQGVPEDFFTERYLRRGR